MQGGHRPRLSSVRQKPLCRAQCPPPRRRCDACEAEFVALTNLYEVDADSLDPALLDFGREGSGLGRSFAIARRITLWRLRRRFLRERPADLKAPSSGGDEGSRSRL